MTYVKKKCEDGPIRFPKNAGRKGNMRQYLMEAQQGRCALCTCFITRFDPMDHDHKTGYVRGILCVSCNNAMAGFDKMQRAGVPIERVTEYMEAVIFPA